MKEEKSGYAFVDTSDNLWIH